MKSIFRNYLFNTGYSIFLLIVPLITTPYVSRVFGAGGVGEYSYAESIVAIFVSIGQLGTSSYGRREVSYHQDDKQLLTKIFWNVFSLRVISGLACCVAYTLYLYLQGFYNIPTILILNIISMILDISWFLQGTEDFKSIAIRNFIVKFVMMCCIFIFIKDERDLGLYTFIICGSTFLGNVSVFTRLRKYISNFSLKDVHPFEGIKTIFSLFLPTIALTFASILDKPIIGWLSNYNESGFYDQSHKIVSVCMMFITSLTTVLVPRIGYCFERNETEKIKFYMYRNYRFVFFLSIPMCFGIIGTAHLLIPLYLGFGYEGAISVLSILSLTILIIGISNVTGVQYLIPTKKQSLFTWSVIIGSLFNFTFDIILVPYYGACGAVIATVVAETIVNVIQFIGIKRDFSFIKILKQARNYLISGIIMYVVIITLNLILFSDFLKLVLMVVVGVGVYFGLLFVLRDEFFLICVDFIWNKFKRKVSL